VAAGIDAALLGKEGDANVLELPGGEVRPEVAGGAAAVTDKDAQAALRGERVACLCGAVVALQGIAKLVEGCEGGNDRFLEGGERLGDVDQDQFGIVAGWCRAEHPHVPACQAAVV
jgi:hypothetical protein